MNKQVTYGGSTQLTAFYYDTQQARHDGRMGRRAWELNNQGMVQAYAGTIYNLPAPLAEVVGLQVPELMEWVVVYVLKACTQFIDPLTVDVVNVPAPVKDRDHSHYWVQDGVLCESYHTIRGLRYRQLLEVPGAPDSDRLTTNEVMQLYVNNPKEAQA
jgi:hypothetical protein